MNLEDIVLSERTNIVIFYLYQVLKVVKLIKKVLMVVARGWGSGNEKLAFNGYGFSLWGDNKVLQKDGGDGCTMMPMDVMPLNGTPRMVKVVSIMFCILHHKKYLNKM